MHTPLYSFHSSNWCLLMTFQIEDKGINIWVSTMSLYHVLHSFNITLFQFIHTILLSRHHLHLVGIWRVKQFAQFKASRTINSVRAEVTSVFVHHCVPNSLCGKCSILIIEWRVGRVGFKSNSESKTQEKEVTSLVSEQYTRSVHLLLLLGSALLSHLRVMFLKNTTEGEIAAETF